MTSKNNVPTDEVVEFELKHRITGAAVLLVFGVLFLPWLLGSPSEANKSDVTDDSTRYQELSAVEIEKELLEAIDNENVDDDIEVYVSRITPLDSASDIRSASDAISSNDAELNNSTKVSC